jgi:uncharacterized protein (TIGR02246 family)
MNLNRKITVLPSLICLSLLLSGAATPVVAAGENPALNKPQSSAVRAQDRADSQEDQVRKLLIDLTAAVNASDADKTVSFWSSDAVFIDEAGESTRGQKALRERFAVTFAQRPEGVVQFHPEKIDFPAPNVSLVVGDVSRKTGAQDLPAARFSFVLVKDHDAWLVSEGTETLIQESNAADHLKELEWLIGNWQVEKPEGAAKLEVDWGSGRNFIMSRCLIPTKGATQIDSQVIGWDPRSKSIVSWHFGCRGGFGYGKWSRQADGWVVDFAGVGADGSEMRATNLFTVKSPSEFVWQSTAQSNNGVSIADSEALKVRKARS